MAYRPRRSFAHSTWPDHRMEPAECAEQVLPLLTVDPRAIERYFIRDDLWSKLRFIPGRLGLPACIRRGGWDRRSRPFAQHPTTTLLRTFEAHDHDADTLREVLSRDFPKRRGNRPRTAQDPRLPGYVDGCRKLASSLQGCGYVPDLAPDHIGVAIGRDGEVIKVADGTHRLALAQRLGLARVIGEVRFVHSGWYRDHVGRDTSNATARIAAALREAGYDVQAPVSPAASPVPGTEQGTTVPARSW